MAEALTLALDLAHESPLFRIVGIRIASHPLGIDANQPAGGTLRQTTSTLISTAVKSEAYAEKGLRNLHRITTFLA